MYSTYIGMTKKKIKIDEKKLKIFFFRSLVLWLYNGRVSAGKTIIPWQNGAGTGQADI